MENNTSEAAEEQVPIVSEPVEETPAEVQKK